MNQLCFAAEQEPYEEKKSVRMLVPNDEVTCGGDSRETKLIHSIIDSLLGSPKAWPRDRSNRLLDARKPRGQLLE